MDALAAHMALLDDSGKILAINRAWRAFAAANSRDIAGLLENANYLAVCDLATGADSAEAAAFAAGIRSVISGAREDFTLEYPCHSPTEERWFTGKVTGFTIEGKSYAVVAHEDITGRKKAEKLAKDLLGEKELILREVHHRIKNNMNSICSLLALQADSLGAGVAGAALDDSAGRVRSMMTLYDKLYRAGSYESISMRDYLPSLAAEIVANFPNRCAVKVETAIEDIVLSARLMQPIGIIVNELLTNIMKYAFEGRSQGSILVSAGAEGQSINLAIKDDGKGIPASVNFDSSPGFGLTLVAALTNQIGGTIRIDRGSGTVIRLEFPR
ncbi:MAG: sensor histidine kinase [Spirochaetota bacterium]